MNLSRVSPFSHLDNDNSSSSNLVTAGLDQGTTSTRIVLFNDNNAPLFVHQVPIALHVSKSSIWVEQDPQEIMNSVMECLKHALSWCHDMNLKIGALGIANQRETLIAWSRKTNLPLASAIVWMDGRTRSIVDSYKCHEIALRNITGLKASTYFSAFKIKWLLENNSDIKKIINKKHNSHKEEEDDDDKGNKIIMKADKETTPNKKSNNDNDESEELMFGTVDSWILWNLTGYTHHITDVTNASRTMLMDLKKRSWSTGLLQLFHINSKWLPTIHDQIVNLRIKFKFRMRSGEMKEFEVPIGSVMGDQQSSFYGHECFEVGDAKCTIGTGTFISINTGGDWIKDDNDLVASIVPSPSAFSLSRLSLPPPLLSSSLSHLPSLQSNFNHDTNDNNKFNYLLEAPLTVGASTLKWFGSLFKLSVQDVCTMASSVSHSNQAIFIPALTGLLAPDWSSDIRASFHQIGMDTSREHLARAVLESIAFSIKRALSPLLLPSSSSKKRENIINIKSLSVDGGLSKANILIQMIADITGLEIKRSCYSEQTAFGVAIRAAENLLKWQRSDDQETEIFSPGPYPNVELENSYERWSKCMNEQFE